MNENTILGRKLVFGDIQQIVKLEEGRRDKFLYKVRTEDDVECIDCGGSGKILEYNFRCKHCSENSCTFDGLFYEDGDNFRCKKCKQSINL